MTHPQFNFGPAEAQQEYSDVFNTLNAAQRQAVRSTATSLQILAGPGSGKTRVLTTRAAYLIRERNLDPKSLMVVTFTKKAARDMRLKLHRMLGDENFNLLRVGTFHSVCLELLNKHAALVGFQENLSVINDKESKDIMKELQATVEPIEDITVDLSEFTDPTTAWEMIKNSKDKGETLEDFRYKVARFSESYNKLVYIANMYRAYEAKLREGNLIDYGSLLLWTVELLKKNRSLLSHIRALLIDEFQDSNGTQFELILEIMKQENPKLLTIVGDPDQAIYGWRSAGPENFNKIRTSIRNTEIVILHENYRSTKCILRAATSVIEQDENRIPKPLTTFNPEGVKMTYMRCQNAFDQAEFISKEIRRCVNESGGVLRHRDVAVLVRTHNLSREIQREFERNGIPYNVVNNRFLEEGPVMDVLAYLGFVHNPFNFIDFKRIINLPKRHIGNVTQEALLNLNKQQGTDFLSTLKYAQSVITKKINVTARISIAAFVAVCESATQMMDENVSDCYVSLTCISEHSSYFTLGKYS
ncbi:P-loop containing nucleoside triphosphate hydrolase protein [Pilobolus umbonatus]|nr:P-loop containing nucleoside triphosphate hydrolase protein [Pilobolus umbonatus]